MEQYVKASIIYFRESGVNPEQFRAVYREAVSIMPLESNTIQSGKADITYDL